MGYSEVLTAVRLQVGVRVEDVVDSRMVWMHCSRRKQSLVPKAVASVRVHSLSDTAAVSAPPGVFVDEEVSRALNAARQDRRWQASRNVT